MTHGTATRRSIDPVLSLKTEMLLRLVENNDVTIKLLRAVGENPLCYFCQSTSWCIILIKQRCTQFSFLRPCKTICAQKRSECWFQTGRPGNQVFVHKQWESLMVVWVPDPSRTWNEQISLMYRACSPEVEPFCVQDTFRQLQDNLAVPYFFFSLESLRFSRKKKKKNESRCRTWKSEAPADSQLISTSH